jgi:hypothetical protein
VSTSIDNSKVQIIQNSGYKINRFYSHTIFQAQVSHNMHHTNNLSRPVKKEKGYNHKGGVFNGYQPFGPPFSGGNKLLT